MGEGGGGRGQGQRDGGVEGQWIYVHELTQQHPPHFDGGGGGAGTMSQYGLAVAACMHAGGTEDGVGEMEGVKE